MHLDKKYKVLHLGRKRHQHLLEALCCESSILKLCRKGFWGSGKQQSHQVPAMCPWTSGILDCIRKSTARVSREGIIPVCSALVRPQLAVPSARLPSSKTQLVQWVHHRTMEMIKGLRHLWHDVRLGEWGCSAWRAEGRGGSQHCVKTAERKEWRRSQTLLSSTHWQDKRRQLHTYTHESQSDHAELPPNPTFCEGSEQWHRLPRDLVESPSTISWRYSRALWTQSWVSGGVEPDDLWKFLPASTTFLFCERRSYVTNYLMA